METMENNNTKFSTLLVFLPVILILTIMIILEIYLQYRYSVLISSSANHYPFPLDRLQRTLIMYEIALPFTGHSQMTKPEILLCMSHARANIPNGLLQENINTIFSMDNPLYVVMDSSITSINQLYMAQKHVAIHYFSSAFAANELAICKDFIVTDEKVVATFQKYLIVVTAAFNGTVTEPGSDTPLSADILSMLCSFFVLIFYVLVRYFTGL